MTDDSKRHDPFAAEDDGKVANLVSKFKPKPKPKAKENPEPRTNVSVVAAQRGFVDRSPKEPAAPVKPLQFRLTADEVEAFNEQALKEYGNEHGGKIKLFRKMMTQYLEINS